MAALVPNGSWTMRQRGVRGDDLDLSMATWVSDKLKTPGMARGILKPTGPEGTPSPGNTVEECLQCGAVGGHSITPVSDSCPLIRCTDIPLVTPLQPWPQDALMANQVIGSFGNLLKEKL